MDAQSKKSVDGKKLISTFHEISKENFNVTDDTILDKLYFNIETTVDLKELFSSYSEEVGIWLELAINGWTMNELVHGVKIFTIRLIGIFGSSADWFENVLKGRKILSFIHNLAGDENMHCDSSVMVPLINSLGMFAQHIKGWEWVMETMSWKCAVKTYYLDKSIYIKKAAVKLLSLLLLEEKLEGDSTLAVDILSLVCEPLIKNHLLTIEKYDSSAGVNVNGREPVSVQESDLHNNCFSNPVYSGDKIIVSSHLVSAAKFACDLLEEVLSSSKTSVILRLNLVSREVNGVKINVLTSDILNSCPSPQNSTSFSFLLLMVSLCNSTTRINLLKSHSTSEKNVCHLLPVYKNTFKAVNSMIHHGYLYPVANFCVTGLTCCDRFKKVNNSSCSDCDFCDSFEKTMIGCLSVLLQTHCNTFQCKPTDGRPRFQVQITPGLENNIAEMYAEKVTAECMINVDHAQKLRIQFIQFGVFGLTRSLKFITNKNIVKDLYLEVCSTLKTLFNHLTSMQELVKPVMIHLLSLASNLIESHQLPNWELDDGNEDNLCTYILKVLHIEHCDTRLTISSLQVLNKVLKLHVAPGLLSNLEVNKVTGTRRKLGELLALEQKLTSLSWEVRDTAVEVLQTVVELSETTSWLTFYPVESEVIRKVLDVGANDESSYVRTTALTFFSKAVRAKLFNAMVTPQTLLSLATQAALEDTMPNVRKAACELITALYINYVPSVLSDPSYIYEVMCIVILKDLNWEVKKASLMFWHCTIEKLLMDSKIPMDSSFLHHIKQDHEEVTLRAVDILETLGDIGCLKAIWLGLNDDCDLKVSQEALTILNHLEELNKHWKFVDILINDESGVSSDQDDEDKMYNPIKYNAKLKPKEFFTNIQKENWKEMLSARSDWIENTCEDLNSLMDHILNEDNKIGDWDHNAVDCY